MPRHSDSVRGNAAVEQLVAEVFREAGLRVRRPRATPDPRPSLIVDGKGSRYVVETKRSAEGRRDRLVPLLAQTILQALAAARNFPGSAIPVAVVSAPRIPPSAVAGAKEYTARYAPEVGIGIIDAEGLRAFAGQGLEMLGSASPSPRLPYERRGRPRYVPNLFSDLNQWMQKILLAHEIPEALLAAPREHLRSASQLARTAGVSAISASRFLRQLAAEGLLSEHDSRLRVVRTSDLMDRWLAASQSPAQDIPV